MGNVKAKDEAAGAEGKAKRGLNSAKENKKKSQGKRVTQDYKNIPCNYGTWKGKKPGNTIWYPDKKHIPTPKDPHPYNNPNKLSWGKILKKYKIEGIQFRNGYPNFRKISRGTVNVGTENFSTDREKNYMLADKAIADKKGCSHTEVQKWMKDEGYTWHECENMKTMMKVPCEVHANIPHRGGISEMKRLNEEKNLK